MATEKLDLKGFTIIKRLGVGARTTIYLALDDETKTKVALKRAVFERPQDSRIFEQVITEYKVSKQIEHPYLRKCYKLIKIRKNFKMIQLLLSMELFEGQALEDSKTLSLGDVLLVFRMVATGLSAMHRSGYIHCDIKPNNILINNDGSIRIIDLGQCCKIGTVKHRIQGTPDYIAPEQVHRKQLDEQTDVFNLGATMYWALTGKNIPTMIPQAESFLSPAQNNKALAPHQIYKKIPLGISKLVMDCVKEVPSQRPANMTEIVSRLDLLIHSIFEKKLGNQ